MTFDYYLSIGSLITGVLTNSPILQAVPTALRLTATVFPRLFPIGISKTLTHEEQKKLDSIKSLFANICKNLEIEDDLKINLRVSHQLGANACMIGTTSSIGGPLICLGNSFFTNYEPLPSDGDAEFREWIEILNETSTIPYQNFSEEQQTRTQQLSEKFKHLSIVKDPEFREWMILMSEIPNTPSDLGKYIDNCSVEKRDRIQLLAKKFKDLLSQNELESILAHEIGHAKHYHLLRSSGIILIALTADKLAQVYANAMGKGVEYEFLSTPLLLMTIMANSKFQEIEADQECSHAIKYQKGMLQFHKKRLINDLFKKTSSSFESKVNEMLQDNDWFSSHPNSAKRFQHATEISQHHNHPKTTMTTVAKIFAGLGIFNLAKMCYVDAREILTKR